MNGTYKARIDNQKAMTRIATIRKNLLKTGVGFTETVEDTPIRVDRHTQACKWDCKNPTHTPLEIHTCVVIHAEGQPKSIKVRAIRKVKPIEWKIPPDWEWTAEDLEFLAATAPLST
jgi:hypothetical protein